MSAALPNGQTERRHNYRRESDYCPLAGTACPVHDRVDHLHNNIKKLESEIAPVSAINRLSQNKLLAGIFILLFAWVAQRIYTAPSSDTVREMGLRQRAIMDELAAIQTFKALTTQRLDNIERVSQDNNDLLKDISQAVGASKK